MKWKEKENQTNSLKLGTVDTFVLQRWVDRIAPNFVFFVWGFTTESILFCFVFFSVWNDAIERSGSEPHVLCVLSVPFFPAGKVRGATNYTDRRGPTVAMKQAIRLFLSIGPGGSAVRENPARKRPCRSAPNRNSTLRGSVPFRRSDRRTWTSFLCCAGSSCWFLSPFFSLSRSLSFIVSCSFVFFVQRFGVFFPAKKRTNAFTDFMTIEMSWIGRMFKFSVICCVFLWSFSALPLCSPAPCGCVHFFIGLINWN